ncbi:hypothetical protein M2102_000307 [Fusobacterium sp. PH5-7]|uniref:DNA double-strand break repair nuclease NurA n=1 Tax=Fusobacterium sp. PH5-7 TaxID=2940528 RepID=UPI00247641B7|nr:DNA double-strand break repair nuclease NurA [Fusobacterium sp. PH5-7]MDH6456694.1 hypothetical protein [Fusobacterium sp. PH5-7]
MSDFNNNADKTTHFEIVNNPDIQLFLNDCKYLIEPTGEEAKEVASLFSKVSIEDENLPNYIIAIDGSSYESSINDNLPFTRVGYVKIGNILIQRDKFNDIGKEKFVDPFKVAEIEKQNSSTIFAFPSSNMQYKGQSNIRDGFRLALDNYMHMYRSEERDYKTSLRSTLFELAKYRKKTEISSDNQYIMLHSCPSCKTENIPVYNIEEQQICPKCGNPIYPTDCLRIWENVEDGISNQSALTRFTNVIEHIFVVHFIRDIINRSPNSFVETLSNIAFFIDGALAIYGNPAWVHGAIQKFLYETNEIMKKNGKCPISIIGNIRNNEVVNYFKYIDTEIPTETILCLSDEIRNKYVNFNKTPSSSTFGNETYYGQDFIYKSKSGKLVVFNIPYPFKDKTDLKIFIKEKSKSSNYKNLNKAILLLEEFECDLYNNTVIPVALARKHTIISLKPGSKILDLLTRNSL